MLSRRFLRVKVLQALYAYFQSDNSAVRKGENELFLSIDRIYDLYLFFLILPMELQHMAEKKQEEAAGKNIPLPEDIQPNTKFVDNRLIRKFREHSQLKKLLEKRKVSWTADQDELKKFFKVLKESDTYKKYMDSPKDDFDHDKSFLLKLYKEVVPDFELIFSKLEERSIYWSIDDVDFALGMVLKTVQKAKEKGDIKLAELYKDPEEDKEFVKNLFRKSITHNEENEELIADKIKNWEMERVAVIDKLLMKMAVTELVYFKSIPVKVTLNEYIELAKWYSSPKSKVFVNGILDKIVADFKADNRINKSGRGLLEH